MNHSCNPNCELVQCGVDGLPSMCFFAKKNIKSGMEFMFDYNCITNPDMDCIKLEVATFKFGDQMTGG
jgi:hypothetical protein